MRCPKTAYFPTFTASSPKLAFRRCETTWAEGAGGMRKHSTSPKRTGGSPTKSTTGYRPDIDGLRAVAVLVVIIHHMDESWMTGAFVGVDIFFVISGFVVAASLLKHPAKTKYDFFLGFYARRIKRLAPALVIVVFAAGLMLGLAVPPSTHSLREYYDSGLFTLVGGANVWFCYGTTRRGAVITHDPLPPPSAPPPHGRSLGAAYFAAVYGDDAADGDGAGDGSARGSINRTRWWQHDLHRNPFLHAWSL